MRNRFQRFMSGRYGNDQFNQFLFVLCLISIVLSLFLGSIFYIIALALLIYSYYRMFSRKVYARARENEIYLEKTAGIRRKWQGFLSRMRQRKTHHIYTCPGCRQKIRVPKGKGKIRITCPKCHCVFEKRS